MTKFQFSALFKEVWLKAIKPETIVSGFQKTGVYPLNPNAVTVPALDASSLSSDKDDSSLTDSCGGPSTHSDPSGDPSIIDPSGAVDPSTRNPSGNPLTSNPSIDPSTIDPSGVVDPLTCNPPAAVHPSTSDSSVGPSTSDPSGAVDPSTNSLSGEPLTNNPPSNPSDEPSTSRSSGDAFNAYTIEQLLLFETRFENEYDIFFTDDSYVQWLLENHPDALSEHVRPVEKPPQHSTPLRHREPARSDHTPTNLEKSSVSTATATRPEIHSPRSAITEFLTCPGYSPSSSKQ